MNCYSIDGYGVDNTTLSKVTTESLIKFFEKYIQPKVDLQEMRTLVSDHSKKQARERWNTL